MGVVASECLRYLGFNGLWSELLHVASRRRQRDISRVEVNFEKSPLERLDAT